MSKENTSNVNHPQHYKGHTSLECIQCMKLIFGEETTQLFCLCNAFKYLWRHKFKNGEEDLNKADWYLSYVNHYIERDGEENISKKVLKAYHKLRDLYIDIYDEMANS